MAPLSILVKISDHIDSKKKFRAPDSTWRLHFDKQDGVEVAYGPYNQVFGKIIPIERQRRGYAYFKKHPDSKPVRVFFRDKREAYGYLEDNAIYPFSYEDFRAFKGPRLIIP